jgi:hypothetical protein
MAAFESNVNRSGGAEFARFSAPDPEVCADACISDARCLAFSYDVAASRCRLSADVPPKVEREGFVSAVKVRSGT